MTQLHLDNQFSRFLRIFSMDVITHMTFVCQNIKKNDVYVRKCTENLYKNVKKGIQELYEYFLNLQNLNKSRKCYYRIQV